MVDEDGNEMVAELARSKDGDERQAHERQEARGLKAQLHLQYTRRVQGTSEHVLDPLATRFEREADAYKQKRRVMLVAKDIG